MLVGMAQGSLTPFFIISIEIKVIRRGALTIWFPPAIFGISGAFPALTSSQTKENQVSRVSPFHLAARLADNRVRRIRSLELRSSVARDGTVTKEIFCTAIRSCTNLKNIAELRRFNPPDSTNFRQTPIPMILTTCIQSIAFAAFLVFPESESKSLQGDLKTANDALQSNDYDKALKTLKGLTEKNDKKALLMMGRIYQQGLPGKGGLQPDAKQAENYFRKAHAAGESAATLELAAILLSDATDKKRQEEGQEMLKTAAKTSSKAKLVLGQLQANGQGFTQDLDAAKKNFEEAGEAGEGEAFSALGQMYEGGKGVKADATLALQNYEKAAERDSVAAMLKLGNVYAVGVKDGDKVVVPADLDKAKKHLVNAASKEADGKAGSTATMTLAAFYDQVAKKPEDAFAAYKKAAEIGDYNAMLKVGYMLKEGQGTAKNADEAFKFFLKSTAETESGKLSGSPAGMYAVSQALEKGEGTKADAAKAKQWLMNSAVTGFGPAMRQVGLNYREGKGVLKDILACTTWLQRALSAGDAESAMILSEMLEKGEGDLPQDLRTSNALLTKVAEAGSAEAQLRLAAYNAEGKGTAKDLIRAYSLLLAAGDYEPAKKKRDELAKTLTKEQINEAMKELERMRNKPSAAAAAPADDKEKDKSK